MKILQTLLFTLMISEVLAIENQSCIPDVDNCDFYLCKKEELDCGQRGYPLHFGHRYCESFLNHPQEHFSKRGQKWLADVRLCLQQKMAKLPEYYSCQQIRQASFRSHYKCYLETHYCQLPLRDKKHLFSLIGKDIMDPMVLIQGIRITARCQSMGRAF
jgi:hypothetical protein